MHPLSKLLRSRGHPRLRSGRPLVSIEPPYLFKLDSGLLLSELTLEEPPHDSLTRLLGQPFIVVPGRVSRRCCRSSYRVLIIGVHIV